MFGMLRKVILTSVLAASLLMTSACSGNTGTGGNETGTSSGKDLKSLGGEVIIDGSSTVFPISEAVAEEFKAVSPNVKVPVGVSGTGGGMKKFVKGEIDICDASRPIKDNEKEDAKKNGIDYIELKVAYDGITVVVNKDNNWVTDITPEDLKKIWEPDSKVKKWKDVNPAWPDEEIKLYGPGADSGTFEYFTEAINKKAKEIRKDYSPSEDDNALVNGIAGDKNAMGYFGHSYYEENSNKLKALTINGVEASFDTIKDGSYKPLSRPLFIYVNKKSMEKEHVKEFVKFYLENASTLVKDAKFVSLNDKDYQDQLAAIK
ncbi:MAG: PstS family phosphate ABC transporter substrate-binding protein [Clostridia bacterium]|nr:PstS family phosphate ABC transporter substrate-binding protein [Clostridia bacterium]